MNEKTDLLVIVRAYHFAAQKHETQCRKGARAEPYINHLTEVAELTAQVTRGTDAHLVAAAVLHDTLEDTQTSEAELLDHFGEDITSLVREATDNKLLPKAERKRQQIVTAPQKTDRAKILKIADKISNVRSLVCSPPDWPKKRKLEYLQWSKDVFKGLSGINEEIDHLFHQAVEEAEKELS